MIVATALRRRIPCASTERAGYITKHSLGGRAGRADPPSSAILTRSILCQPFFNAKADDAVRDEDLKLRLNTDPHSPGRFRTIGPLSNFVEFQKAFDIPDGSPMMRPANERVNIW
jgi:Peptidase family M13